MTEEQIEKGKIIEAFARDTLVALTYVEPYTTRDWATMGYITLMMVGLLVFVGLFFL